MDRITPHRNRGLHLGFAATVALVTVIAVLDWSPWSTRWPAVAMLAVLVAAYVAYGWRGYDAPRAAAAFVPLLVVAAFVLPAVVPSTGFIQCILFPVAWCQLERVRTAVAVSVAIGIASGLGLQVSTGSEAIVGNVLVEGVSVIGACAIGLWITKVAVLSDERRQLLEQLQAAQDSLAEAHRSAGVTSERERLARELHDTVAQDLAGIVMLTERARGDLDARRIDRLGERLAVLEESARTALEESRTLVAASAAGIAGDGLGAALHRLGERTTRETDIPVSVDVPDCALDRDTQVVLLRVCQEALANVRAHARATSVHVGLEVGAGRATLRVRDDGVGFDTSASTAGHGLRGLHDRLALAGGACSVSSVPGSGTTVEVTVPVLPAPEPTALADANDPGTATTPADANDPRTATTSPGATGPGIAITPPGAAGPGTATASADATNPRTPTAPAVADGPALAPAPADATSVDTATTPVRAAPGLQAVAAAHDRGSR